MDESDPDSGRHPLDDRPLPRGCQAGLDDGLVTAVAALARWTEDVDSIWPGSCRPWADTEQETALRWALFPKSDVPVTVVVDARAASGGDAPA
jgi:hypothetical protein